MWASVCDKLSCSIFQGREFMSREKKEDNGGAMELGGGKKEGLVISPFSSSPHDWLYSPVQSQKGAAEKSSVANAGAFTRTASWGTRQEMRRGTCFSTLDHIWEHAPWSPTPFSSGGMLELNGLGIGCVGTSKLGSRVVWSPNPLRCNNSEPKKVTAFESFEHNKRVAALMTCQGATPDVIPGCIIPQKIRTTAEETAGLGTHENEASTKAVGDRNPWPIRNDAIRCCPSTNFVAGILSHQESDVALAPCGKHSLPFLATMPANDVAQLKSASDEGKFAREVGAQSDFIHDESKTEANQQGANDEGGFARFVGDDSLIRIESKKESTKGGFERVR